MSLTVSLFLFIAPVPHLVFTTHHHTTTLHNRLPVFLSLSVSAVTHARDTFEHTHTHLCDTPEHEHTHPRENAI